MPTVPLVPIDPDRIRTAAGRLRQHAAAAAEQADVVVRTWSGLGPLYVAPETPALLAALDPVAAAVDARRERLVAVATALETFAFQVENTLRLLDGLRPEAASPVRTPFLDADLESRIALLMAELEQLEQECAAAVRAELDRYDAAPSAASWLSSGLSWVALRIGDQAIGAGYLDSDLELSMLTHFTNGTGDVYVLTDADLAALRADPAVQRAGADLRAGVSADAVPVTLEGGTPGYRIDIDFKQPVEGRTVNPFDGSLGRAHVYYDAAGQPVGVADVFDFTNGGDPVDLTNLDAAVFGSRPFHDRGGIVEQQPSTEVPAEPHLPSALDRIFRRHVLGEDPGSYSGPPR